MPLAAAGRATRPRHRMAAGGGATAAGRDPASGGSPSTAGSPDAVADVRVRLLLVALLANAARVGVGAFVDVALAGNSALAPRLLSGTVPHCRPGR